MFIQGQAGYSALRQAVRLWFQHAQQVTLWAAGAGTGGVAVIAVSAGGLSVGSLAAGGVTAVGVAVWRSRQPSRWRSWLQGAKAERRTGKLLNSLRRDGWGVLHDRSIPRSRANLDHVLAHPSGNFLIYVDTKAWHAAKATIRVDRNRLMYGPWNQGPKAETVAWEASRLSEGTGMRVIPMIVVDGGKVNGDVLIFNDVYVVSANVLLRTLDAIQPNLVSRIDEVREITRTIERGFAAAR